MITIHRYHQNQKTHCDNKLNLFKVLIISWSVGFSLSYFKDVNIDYQVKCVLMSLIYFLFSVFCYRYIIAELKLKRNLSAYLVAALCMCMIISCWFNFLFSNPDIYYLMIDIKQGDGLSWKNIYKSVELMALLTVGRNGIINFNGWLVCRCRRINVIIANNSTYNLGR